MTAKPHNISIPPKHKFIVIEGVDGVGKTTVAKVLAGQLGAIYYRTPSSDIESFFVSSVFQTRMSLREYVDRHAYSDPKVRFSFYLFTVLEASIHISKLLKDKSVVCDRYLSSTIAYHRALCPDLIDADLSWVQSIKPDVEVLLDVSDDLVHLQRLRSHVANSDEALEHNFKFLQLVKQEYRRLGLPTIDTSTENVQQVVTRIASML